MTFAPVSLTTSADPSVGILTWVPTADAAELSAAMAPVIDGGFTVGLERIEARLSPADAPGRRALHRVGFRREGRLRSAARTPDGREDVLLYALLRSDVRSGREAFTAVMNTVTPRKRLIAHALITDEQGRILLCETSFKPDWELPGGIVEPGESPRTGCAREITEELAISVPLGRLLAVDWLTPHLGWEDAVELIWSTDPLPEADRAAITPDGTEIVAAHWLSLEEACTRVAPYAAGRLRSAWAAWSDGGTAILEDGEPVMHGSLPGV